MFVYNLFLVIFNWLDLIVGLLILYSCVINYLALVFGDLCFVLVRTSQVTWHYMSRICTTCLFQVILFVICAANELFFCMLYLVYFTTGPVCKFFNQLVSVSVSVHLLSAVLAPRMWAFN